MCSLDLYSHRSGYVIDRIQHALRRSFVFSEGRSSLLSRKKCFQKGSAFGRLGLDCCHVGRRSADKRFVWLQCRSQVSQLRVFNG